MNFKEFLDQIDVILGKYINISFVECYECSCILKKESAKQVLINTHTYYYCGKCKPNYDEAYLPEDNGGMICGYYKNTYLKNRVEVDKNGNPIIKK
jgi:hypothetical protein